RLRSLVNVHGGRLDATGRLFTVDTLSFGESPLKFPRIQATLVIDAFVYGVPGAAPTTLTPASTTATTTTGTDTTSTTTTSTTPTGTPSLAAPTLSGSEQSTAVTPTDGSALTSGDVPPPANDGQLASFSRFASKDPFAQQLSDDATGGSGSGSSSGGGSSP